MKTPLLLTLLFVGLLAAGAALAAEPSNLDKSGFDATYRLIYYSVLEGAFEDGLGNADVDRILLRGPDGSAFMHFIYACPLCGPTSSALLAYRQRAPIYGYKIHGPGLPVEQRIQLNSPEQTVRLGIINQLVKQWVERRLASQRLSPAERKAVQEQLEAGRKQGMEQLQEFKRMVRESTDNKLSLRNVGV